MKLTRLRNSKETLKTQHELQDWNQLLRYKACFWAADQDPHIFLTHD